MCHFDPFDKAQGRLREKSFVRLGELTLNLNVNLPCILAPPGLAYVVRSMLLVSETKPSDKFVAGCEAGVVRGIFAALPRSVGIVIYPLAS
jgi:hypothetical protein